MQSTHWLVLCMQLHHVLPHYITQLHHPHLHSHCAASYWHHLTTQWRVMLLIVQQLRYFQRWKHTIFEVMCYINILNTLIRTLQFLSTPGVCSDGSVRDYSSYIEDVHYMVEDTEYCMHICSTVIVTLLLGHSRSFCCWRRIGECYELHVLLSPVANKPAMYIVF